jgi:hypothetical protein
VAANVSDADAGVLIADAQHRELIDDVRADLSSVRHFLHENPADGWEPIDDGRNVITLRKLRRAVPDLVSCGSN